MYRGIGPETGITVSDEDAFSYACMRIFSEPQEERITAMQIFRESECFPEAEERLTEWYYSGNWIREKPEDKEKTFTHKRTNAMEHIFWIRYSDGALGCAAEYRKAVERAEEYIKDTELTYLIY